MNVHSFSYLDKMIKAETDRINRNTIDIAQMVCYIKFNELWKENFSSFNEYVKEELKLRKSTLSSYTQVVYKFCEKDEYSNTGYCVKSLFRDYQFSQLKEMTFLTEEEISQLKINSSMSVRDIRKLVKEYIKVLDGSKDNSEKAEEVKEDKKVKEDNSILKYNHSYIDDSIFRFFDCDKCNVKDMKKTVSVDTGLRYLRNQIVKDNEYVYVVVKVPKNYIEKENLK